MKEGRKPEHPEKTPGDELQKMPHTTARIFKPQARLEPAQQHWWQARKADMLTVTTRVAPNSIPSLGNRWQTLCGHISHIAPQISATCAYPPPAPVTRIKASLSTRGAGARDKIYGCQASEGGKASQLMGIGGAYCSTGRTENDKERQV